MTTLEEVKTALRLTSNAFDEGELLPLIESCKLDLSVSGVKIISEDDALIRQAIKLYCKANFGNNEDSVKFQTAYDKLKDSLALCGDYNE
ncbi:MAG: head-tail connector protein [Hominimerdicola sp.]